MEGSLSQPLCKAQGFHIKFPNQKLGPFKKLDMNLMTMKPLTLCLLFILFTLPVLSQLPDATLSAREKEIVIDSICSKLRSTYVFPEVANQMNEHIQSKLQQGDYTAILDPVEFANLLTTDLQSISRDRHLRVSFSPEEIAEQQVVISAEDSLMYRNRFISRMKQSNLGFREVKILEGNIGYLDLRGFSNVEFAGETAVASMNFLSNSDAIIIDLRNNGGGSPTMIQLISSYLFGSEPVHLNNFYWRPTDTHSQTWTLPHVPGTRSPDTPVYVLTSNNSFSAAEEFSYNLKNLNRATLVGETTGGGAHPGGPVVATDRFMVWVPTGRAISPITETNWEGTGVSPHIDVPAGEAFDTAYRNALESLQLAADQELKAFYEWPLARLKVKSKPVVLDAATLKKFAGTYGQRSITLENGSLYYQRGQGTKYELYPYGPREFMLKGLDDFRIHFISDNGKVTALQGLYENGHTDQNLKGS